MVITFRYIIPRHTQNHHHNTFPFRTHSIHARLPCSPQSRCICGPPCRRQTLEPIVEHRFGPVAIDQQHDGQLPHFGVPHRVTLVILQTVGATLRQSGRTETAKWGRRLAAVARRQGAYDREDTGVYDAHQFGIPVDLHIELCGPKTAPFGDVCGTKCLQRRGQNCTAQQQQVDQKGKNQSAIICALRWLICNV